MNMNVLELAYISPESGVVVSQKTITEEYSSDMSGLGSKDKII